MIKSVTDVLLLTATQNIPQRGHCESVESDKRGNFLVTLEQIAKHDPIEKKEMEGMLHAQVIPQQKEILVWQRWFSIISSKRSKKSFKSTF